MVESYVAIFLKPKSWDLSPNFWTMKFLTLETDTCATDKYVKKYSYSYQKSSMKCELPL